LFRRSLGRVPRSYCSPIRNMVIIFCANRFWNNFVLSTSLIYRRSFGNGRLRKLPRIIRPINFPFLFDFNGFMHCCLSRNIYKLNQLCPSEDTNGKKEKHHIISYTYQLHLFRCYPKSLCLPEPTLVLAREI